MTRDRAGSTRSIDDVDVVVDTDVHTPYGGSESILDDLSEYVPEPFDGLLSVDDDRYVHGTLVPSAGYLHPADISRLDREQLDSPGSVRRVMDMLGTDRSIISGGPLRLGFIHHSDLGAAFAEAFNEWVLDALLDEVEGCYANALVCPQKPHSAAEEIDDRAGEDDIVGVMVPSGGTVPPLGDEGYFPIYEAAEDAGLPVSLHGAANGHMASFPSQWRATERFIDMHAAGHPSEMMFHVSTLLTNGVPVRYPDLEFVVQEAGLGWIPFFMHRYDNEFSEKPHDAPLLERKPSSYIDDRFYFTSQPIEGAEDPEYLRGVVRAFNGAENLMFSSDYPHFDFDFTDQLFDVFADEFTPDELDAIYGGTALSVYDF